MTIFRLLLIIIAGWHFKNKGIVMNLKEKKLRTCRTLQFCCICKKDIRLGEQYYDGGYNKRAHKLCVEKK